MRWPSWTLAALAALIVVVAISGCSRITFLRPDTGRQDFRRVAPDMNFDTDDRNRGTAGAMLLVREGQQHLAQGDLASAERAAAKAMKLAPASPLGHTLMALVEDRRGDGRGAGEHYRRAVELAPSEGALLNNYGAWLCGQGHAVESLDWFERALADDRYPSPAAALANAGVCAQRAGRNDRAGQYLDRAIELDPANPVVLGLLAEREFRSGSALRARAFSQRRLAAAAADPGALLLASQIEEKLGDKAAADRYVQQLRAEFPTASGSEKGDVGKR